MTLRPPVQTIVDTCRYLVDSDNIGVDGNKGTHAAALCTIM